MDCDIDSIAKDTDGFSGSDLYELCKIAGLEAIANNSNTINNEHIEYALNELKIY